MHQTRRYVTAVLAAAGMVVSGSVAAGPAAAQPRPDAAPVSVRVPAVGVPAVGGTVAEEAAAKEAAAEAAMRYAASLLAPAPVGVPVTLAVAGALPLAGGRTLVRVVQRADGITVEAAEVRVVVGPDGAVQSATGAFGRVLAPLDWPLLPDAAAARAVRAAADRARLSRSAMRVTEVERVAADPAVLAAAGAPLGTAAAGVRGAYVVTVAGPTGVDRPVAGPSAVDRYVDRAGARVVVDALDGAVLAVQPRSRALDRVVCDGGNERRSLSAGICRAIVAARQEGSGPVGLAEVDRAYDILGRTSAFFDTLGVDLTRMIGYDFGDGRGRQLRATVRYCPPPDVDQCPMVNAFWLDDGSTDPYHGGVMFIGAGLVADDVIAHELTHGVTAATASLAYSGEPGALNESMSDVFGELVDQATLEPGESPAVEGRWPVGESLPGGAVRSMSDPSGPGADVRQHDRMGSRLWWTRTADDGGVHVNSGVGNKTAYLIAVGGSFRGLDVVGIGPAKTAALYWDVLPRLTPGAGYATLGSSLRQSCGELSAAGIAQLTAADCTSVDARSRPPAHRASAPRARGHRGRRPRRGPTQGRDPCGASRDGAAAPPAEVTLQARTATDADWVGVETKAVNPVGRVGFVVRPRQTTRYRVVSAASGPRSDGRVGRGQRRRHAGA